MPIKQEISTNRFIAAVIVNCSGNPITKDRQSKAEQDPENETGG